jgi:hypothetical protein
MTAPTNEELNEGIARIEGLLRTLVRIQMAPILERELTNGFASKLWPLTGMAKRNDIMKKLKCGPNRVAEMWARWEQFGLIVKKGHNYKKMV